MNPRFYWHFICKPRKLKDSSPALPELSGHSIFQQILIINPLNLKVSVYQQNIFGQSQKEACSRFP